MSYTLCVIDMQHYFYASRDKKVQQACVREIKKAIKDKATILFIEYSTQYYGSTIPLLTNLTKKAKYKKAFTVIKSSDDGGDAIHAFMDKRRLPKMNLRVCGVNTNYCVSATVSGINRKLKPSNIHVVGDACNSTTADGHRWGLSSMKKMPNVKVIREKA